MDEKATWVAFSKKQKKFWMKKQLGLLFLKNKKNSG